MTHYRAIQILANEISDCNGHQLGAHGSHWSTNHADFLSRFQSINLR